MYRIHRMLKDATIPELEAELLLRRQNEQINKQNQFLNETSLEYLPKVVSYKFIGIESRNVCIELTFESNIGGALKPTNTKQIEFLCTEDYERWNDDNAKYLDNAIRI